MKEQPAMQDYQKEYIEMIAEKTARKITENLPCKNYEKRIRTIENKIFNGFGFRINLLFGLYAIFLGVLIKLAFF